MKIFCLGFHKTGTLSLKHALKKLGYRTQHGYKKHSDLIKKALHDGKKPLTYIEGAVGEKDAYLDLYAVRYHFVRLDKEYDAKFILTTRNEDDWVGSVKRQMKRNPNSPFYHYWYYQSELQWRYDKRGDEACIRKYFKDRDNFLEMDITDGDGWDELCAFLGKEIPDEPFPHKNKSH